MREELPVVLVVSDDNPTLPALLAALRARAALGPATYRLLLTNPAAHEVSFRADRHRQVEVAEYLLADWVPLLAQVTGAQVWASVSIRHDPREAVEELLLRDTVDEVIFSVAARPIAIRLHCDLGHWLTRQGLPWADANAVGVGSTMAPA